MKKLVLLLVVVMILGCSPQSDKLVIGIIKPSLNHFPLDFAFKADFLAEKNLKIKHFSSGWETNEALVAGKIDVAIMPFTYAWTDVSNEKDIKIISFLERESDGIIAGKQYQTLEDLKGRRIGVLKASTLDIFAEMKKTEHRAELVYFRTPMDMAAALRSGEVDALSYYVPSIFKFDKDKFHIIHWYGDDFRFHPCCDLCATKKAIQTKQEEISNLMNRLKQSCTEINRSPQAAYKTASEIFGISTELAKQSLYHTRFIMGLNESYRQFELQAVEIIREKGYIQKPVDPAEIYYEIE